MTLNYTPLNIEVFKKKFEKKGFSFVLLSLIIFLTIIVAVLIGYIFIVRSM
jgi:nitrate reductase NapE component